MRTAKTLIRLGRCPGWSECSLGAHAILLVLSWGGSIVCFVIFHVCEWHFSSLVCFMCKPGCHSSLGKSSWVFNWHCTRGVFGVVSWSFYTQLMLWVTQLMLWVKYGICLHQLVIIALSLEITFMRSRQCARLLILLSRVRELEIGSKARSVFV